LTILQSAGFSWKISQNDILQILFHIRSCSNKFDTFVELLGSNSHPLLPTREELSSIPVETILELILPLPGSSIRALVAVLGPVRFKPSALEPLLLDPKRRQMVLELGLITLDDLSHPESEYDNCFHFVDSKGSFRWMLSIIGKNDAIGLLRQASNLELCPFLYLAKNVKYARILLENFQGLNPLYSFADDDDSLRQVFETVSSPSLLKLVIDSTGVQNISRETQGHLIWRLMSFKPSVPILLYLLEALESPLLVDKPYFYEGTIIRAFERASASRAQVDVLLVIFRRFQHDLIQQASEYPANAPLKLNSILYGLAKWIVSVSVGRFSTADVDFVVENIFSPIARLCSDRAESPSCKIAQLEIGDKKFTPPDEEARPILQRLFNICAAIDFHEVSRDECHLQFAHFIAMNAGKMKKRSFFHTIEHWLDKINPCAVNQRAPGSELNLFDSILQEDVAPQFANFEELLHRLVQRGCRLSDPKNFRSYCCHDEEALDLYLYAVQFPQDPKNPNI
jgi:hypothetical protein